MRLGGRASTTTGLTLGVLVGLGLVVLPGILAPSSPASTSTGTYANSGSRFPIPTITSSNSPSNSQPGQTSEAMTIWSMVVVLGLIVLPAIGLGFVAKSQSTKRNLRKFKDVDSTV